MKKFFIYIKNNGDRKAVKLGWSWPAFLFSFIWSACMQLWLITLISFPVFFILHFATSIPIHNQIDSIAILFFSICNIAIRIVFGALGNSWKRKKLENSGYIFSKSIMAGNKNKAIWNYINDKNE